MKSRKMIEVALRALWITTKSRREDIWWSKDVLYALCNDLFYWGCADSIVITEDILMYLKIP